MTRSSAKKAPAKKATAKKAASKKAEPTQNPHSPGFGIVDKFEPPKER